jgi:molecular chaperone DnaK
VIPKLRERVAEALGAPFGEGLDPMTLVAQGAALFAAAAALDARPVEHDVTATGPRVWLQHPAMTADLTPYVVGKLLSDTDRVRQVRVARGDGSWTSRPEALDSDGTFSVMLQLSPRRSNDFSVEGLSSDGQAVPLVPRSFTIVHGVAIGEPPLSRSIGVALATNHVQVYVERGAPLPMRRTFRHRTVETVGPELDGYALRIPFVQGEFPWAHLCRLVGTLEIPSRALSATLPTGSDIEVTIEVDRGGRLAAHARIAALDQVFDQVAQLVVPTLALEDLDAALEEAKHRVHEMRVRAFREGGASVLAALGDAERVIDEVAACARAARGGDADSGEKARRLLVDLNALIETQESERAWPDLEARVRHEQGVALSWLGLHGTDAERTAADRSIAAIDRALVARNAQEVERQLHLLRRLSNAAYFREPDSWEWQFEALAARASEATDLPKAQELVEKGNRAVQKGDRPALEGVVRKLWALLPGDPEDRELGHRSGVR